MKKAGLFFLFSIVALAVISVFSLNAHARSGIAIPGRYIVVLHDDAEPADSVSNDMLGAGKILTRGHLYKSALKGFSAYIPAHKLTAVRSDARVAHVEPDVTVHAIARGGNGGGGSKKPGGGGGGGDTTLPPQVIPTGIDRINADLNPYANIDGIDERIDVDVAVIDTGVSNRHPDINFFRGVTVAGAGRPGGNDDNGHGSHVAGTIGAIDNNQGVVGVAPGARIWAVKVLDKFGSGTLSAVLAGIDYVTANAANIEVANMSLGFQGTSSALNTALANSVAAGVTYVVAAGNLSIDASSYSPASHPDVITVSAITDTDGKSGSLGKLSSYGSSDRNGDGVADGTDDNFAHFSNFGSAVDIAAPGVDIRSTWKGDKYSSVSGTSMAAPHVAGAAALYLSIYSMDPASLKADLISRATLQYAPDGFTGDPDNYSEPLLNVEY